MSITVKRRDNKILTTAIALIAVTGNGVQANEVSEPTKDNNFEIEEIVVTATKKGAMALSDVPLAISAISGDSLKDSGMLDLAEAVQLVPGVSEGLSSGSRAQKIINIRSIAQNVNISEGTTGYYLGDAAFFSAPQAPTSRLYDMERVEVLRGPQSTLYGNGAMGGVVRFIPNAPNLSEFEVSGFGGWSETEGGANNHHAYGAINVPLINESLALRVAGGYEEVGGFGDTGAPGAVTGKNQDGGKIKSVRAVLGYESASDLSASLLAQYNKSEFGTVGSFTLANNGFVNGGPDDVREDEYLMLAGTINYDLGFAELTTVTTSIEWEERGLLDVEIAGFAALNQQTLEERSYIGNETRLASAGEGPLGWVFGLFYSDDTLDIKEASVAENLLPFGADADGNTVIADVSSLAATERQTIAVFGEISYELMEGKLVPLFGLRYYEEDFRSTTDSITNISVSSMGNGAILHDPALPLGSIPNSEDSGELRFNSTNPRFNLAYYPTDGSTYYVNIAKGFRGGNANTSALCPITTGCPASVPSDKLWSYEVGTKQSWLSGQVTWDAALYYMDWQGVREFVNFVTVNAQIGAGDAEIYGVDFSLTARPQAIPGLMLNMVGNWNSSELKNLEQIAIDNGAAEGDKVSFVPDWTFTLGVDYQREIADNLTLHVNTSFSHIEEQRSGFGDLAFVAGSKGFGDKRDLLRARIGVKTEKLGVYLVGANLLNEDGPINDGSGIVTLDYPRTLGLEISADY